MFIKCATALFILPHTLFVGSSVALTSFKNLCVVAFVNAWVMNSCTFEKAYSNKASSKLGTSSIFFFNAVIETFLNLFIDIYRLPSVLLSSSVKYPCRNSWSITSSNFLGVSRLSLLSWSLLVLGIQAPLTLSVLPARSIVLPSISPWMCDPKVSKPLKITLAKILYCSESDFSTTSSSIFLAPSLPTSIP